MCFNGVSNISIQVSDNYTENDQLKINNDMKLNKYCYIKLCKL